MSWEELNERADSERTAGRQLYKLMNFNVQTNNDFINNVKESQRYEQKVGLKVLVTLTAVERFEVHIEGLSRNVVKQIAF